MAFTNSSESYGIVTRVLHWLVALLIIALVPLGWWMVGLSYYDAWYHDALELHKALGMIALMLGTVKTCWYLGNARVAFADGLKAWERATARAVHWTFLVAMVLIPATGYLISTSAGDGISMFGWFDVPAAVALACVHAGAALKHQFVDRDGTLRKMLW
jgi:cytochrome b561